MEKNIFIVCFNEDIAESLAKEIAINKGYRYINTEACISFLLAKQFDKKNKIRTMDLEKEELKMLLKLTNVTKTVIKITYNLLFKENLLDYFKKTCKIIFIKESEQDIFSRVQYNKNFDVVNYLAYKDHVKDLEKACDFTIAVEHPFEITKAILMSVI